jgi:hypothetical protein
MAFEPKKQIVVGSTQILNRDVKMHVGTFTKGTPVIVTGIGERGYSFREPESGYEVIECGFTCFEES